MRAEAGVHRLVRLSPFDAQNRRQTSFAAVEEIASAAIGKDEKSYRTDFLDLVRKAATLK